MARLMLLSKQVMTTNPKEWEDAERVIGMLDTKETDICSKIDIASRDFQTLIGGPPGQLLPPPPSSNNSTTICNGGPTPTASSTPAASLGLPPHAPKSII